MKRFSTITLVLLLVAVFTLPAVASAAPSAGIKPSSFFYFFDIASERVSLFFTFNPEKKARKALGYADERLAEVEAVAGDNDAEAVKTAITNYKSSIAFVAEKSKDIGEKDRAEAILTTISDSTSKHQEVLIDVLAKVPDEAKEAITKAIETSKKGQDEALKHIAELKQEVVELKQEIVELRKQQGTKLPTPQSIDRETQSTSIKELKKKIEELKKQTAEKEEREKQQITTPAVPAMPTAPATPTTPMPTPQPTPTPVSMPTPEPLKIMSIGVAQDRTFAKIEWQTNIPTDSKIFISGGSLSSKVYKSESGLSTRHFVNATGLSSGTSYSYEIESITGEQIAKKDGFFLTRPDEYVISVQADKTSVPITNWHYVNFKVSTLKNGQTQTNQSVSVVTPDATQNKTFSDSFNYYPKTIGTHTLAFSWNGVSKSIDIRAIEYVKVDPVIQGVNLNPVFDKTSWSSDQITIGSFKFSQADEATFIDKIEYESDIQLLEKLRIQQSAGGYIGCAATECTPASQMSTAYESFHSVVSFPSKLPIGKHTFSIKNIKLIGQSSGNYRYPSGLPVTFTFEVK